MGVAPAEADRGGPLAGLPGARVAGIAFLVVILATAGAFALAQRLKRAPTLIYDEQAVQLFSPKVPGPAERARFSFKLRVDDDLATLLVTNLAGEPIRTIKEDIPVTYGKQIKSSWDGADDAGRAVPDGLYRVQVVLQEAGRSVQLPFTFEKDTTPPQPKLLSIGPEKTGDRPRPELLPRADRKPAVVRFRAVGRSRMITVFRTDLVRPRVVLEVPIVDDTGKWEWDGTVDDKPVAQGTYVVAVSAKDRVGNTGWSTGSADPVAAFGQRLKGRGGITVRYLAAQSPQAAVPAAERAEIGVISAGKQYRWNIRRVGESRPRSRGETRRPLLRPKLPDGPSGLHILELRTKDRISKATILTQGGKAQKILVVVPQTSLVGAMGVDDDGDGAPDTLDRGVSVQTARVPVDPELPADLTDNIAPLLLALDRKERRYDLTTDLALARGEGPKLAGHDGVVLAGTAKYVDRRLQQQLVTWVRRGGRLWISEPDSLLRSVVVGPTEARRPTQPSRLDPFGFELGPQQEVSEVVQSASQSGLLKGTDGSFDGPLLVEPVLRAPSDARTLAEATTPGGGQVVLSAVEFGRGAVIRSGISGLGASSLRDPDAREFVRQVWSFLRGG
ncbi:MAG: hypothetical protein JHD16_05540 [Solirubrobacteraceae bacterium]|nr:hypothetical protein [Solirubrobacteraceae bacterium]